MTYNVFGGTLNPTQSITIDGAGDVMRWEQQLRFRHLTTRQYLCITTDRRVTLTADSKDPRTVFRLLTGDSRDPRTVFRLHPVIKVCVIISIIQCQVRCQG